MADNTDKLADDIERRFGKGVEHRPLDWQTRDRIIKALRTSTAEAGAGLREALEKLADMVDEIYRKYDLWLDADDRAIAQRARSTLLSTAPADDAPKQRVKAEYGCGHSSLAPDAPTEIRLPADAQAVEAMAGHVHAAMVWAAQAKGGQPKPWQGGNSTAEDEARRAARAALSAAQQGHESWPPPGFKTLAQFNREQFSAPERSGEREKALREAAAVADQMGNEWKGRNKWEHIRMDEAQGIRDAIIALIDQPKEQGHE